MLKKLWHTALVIAILAGILAAGLLYFRFVSNRIYEESANHLTEIYTQVKHSVHNVVSRNWKNLQTWAPYLRDVQDEDKLTDYFRRQQEQWGFTDFYFISYDGFYRTLDGHTGYFDMKAQLPKLILEDQCVVLDTVLPDSPELKVFAAPTDPGTFQGFSYEAIAISYSNRDMVSALDISAFGGQSAGYVTYSNGRVLIDNAGDINLHVFNFLAYLENESDMSAPQLEELRQSFRQGESGVTTFFAAEELYYLVYAPADFEDWMVLSVVPAHVANASMDQLYKITLFVVTGFTASLSLALFIFLIHRSRKSLAKKDTEIQYREELFGTLANNVDDIFLMLNADDWSVSYISPNIQKLLGVSVAEAEQTICRTGLLMQRPNEKGPMDKLRGIGLGERLEWEQEYLHAVTGESRWYHVLAYCTEINGSKRYMIVLSDRTDDQKLNQTLRNALEVARSANEAKSNFLANISHDIRTPMNAIIGFSTLLDRDADKPEKVREYAKKIDFSGHHLLGIINDILDMSKIESGRTSLHPVEFSLKEMLQEIYAIVSNQTRVKKQALNIHTKGDLPDRVIGDQTRLNQILLNLLSNAVKYTPKGGRIAFTLESLQPTVRRHAHIRFVVEDNGLGMSPDFIKTIFEPFSREDTEQKRSIQGTGLGMAIAKNMVDLMGGTIAVESAPGQGSRFTVELELQIAEGETDARFWSLHHITRLLLASDDEKTCQNVQELLRDTGVCITRAADGAQAVKLASDAYDSQKAFQILLLDWESPAVDGPETARRLRTQIGRAPLILALTACNFSDKEEAAKAAGVNVLLPKHFLMSGFQQAVEQYYTENPQAVIPDPAASIKGLHILAAEDNEINAEILTELLASEGVACEVVGNGQEALERFARSGEGEFAMIFMDIHMPVMDGYETARRIRRCGHPDAGKIPIVAMTANAFDDDVRKALDAGMNAHVAKPVNINRLRLLMAELR